MRELRFRRFLCLDRDVPRVKGECAWCGGPSVSKYCSDACRAEAWIRRGGDSVTCQVFARDRGICAACGIDAHAIARAKYELRRIEKAWATTLSLRRLVHAVLHRGWGPWRTGNYVYWEADHIVPVIEGGGCCGLDNYRTLCLRCHKADTAALARSRARRRDIKKNGPMLALEGGAG